MIEPDEIPDVDLDAPLDLTGGGHGRHVAGRRRGRGRRAEPRAGGTAAEPEGRLLGSLLRPHRRSLLLAAALITINTAALLAVPLLIDVGIDKGIPPLLDGESGSLRPLLTVVAAMVVMTLLGAVTFNAFLTILGRVGQDVVLDLRHHVFVHFQDLSLSFHERYTSGHVISRQTSDIEAISDMLKSGIVTLVTSVLTITGIAIVLVLLNPPLAIPVLGTLVVIFVLTRWFHGQSSRASPRHTTDRVGDRALRREPRRGVRAVHAFRREPRNQEIFEHLDDRYRRANLGRSDYRGGLRPGRATRRPDDHRDRGVLRRLARDRRARERRVVAAFLLYLRRFFEPMQGVSSTTCPGRGGRTQRCRACSRSR